MEVVILRLKVPPEKRADTVNIIRPIIGPIEAQPGCMLCRLYCETDDDAALLLMQKWCSRQDLKKSIHSDDFKRILAAMDLAVEEPKILFYKVENVSGFELIERIRT